MQENGEHLQVKIMAIHQATMADKGGGRKCWRRRRCSALDGDDWQRLSLFEPLANFSLFHFLVTLSLVSCFFNINLQQ